MCHMMFTCQYIMSCKALIHMGKMLRSRSKSSAAATAATGTVTSQLTTILLRTDHSMLLRPVSTMPTATMEPI